MRCYYCKNKGLDHIVFVSCQTCGLYLQITKERELFLKHRLQFSITNTLLLIYVFQNKLILCRFHRFFFVVNNVLIQKGMFIEYLFQLLFYEFLLLFLYRRVTADSRYGKSNTKIKKIPKNTLPFHIQFITLLFIIIKNLLRILNMLCLIQDHCDLKYCKLSMIEKIRKESKPLTLN